MQLSECLTSRHQAQVMKLVRELVDSVVVYNRKDDELVRFDVRGRLSALLNMGGRSGPRTWSEHVGGFSGAQGQN